MTEDWPKMCKTFVVFNFITYTVGKGQKPQDGNMRKKKTNYYLCLTRIQSSSFGVSFHG